VTFIPHLSLSEVKDLGHARLKKSGARSNLTRRRSQRPDGDPAKGRYVLDK